MTRISAVVLAIVLLFGALPAMAADGGARTCALTKAIQCTPDEGCEEVTLQDMALPRFVRIDLASKTITSLDKEVERSTKISSVERLEGVTVMHGTERRGWSIELAETTGALTLSVAGESEGFILFGSCITP